MTNLFFYGILFILIAQYLLDTYIDYCNAKQFSDPIPDTLDGIYNKEEYRKSQAYKKTNYNFGVLSSSFSLVVLLAFLLLGGFEWTDAIARSYSNNNIVVGLLFFGILMFGNSILGIPFSYYHTFVIEAQFGFNKTSKVTFWLDKLKSLLLMGIIGGVILAAIIWFYEESGTNFWWYAWLLIFVFSVLANLLYTKWIVPLFNKQSPLEDGPLKNAIKNYAQKTGFSLHKIMVIDGSKRSSKANAYFSGFGKTKQVTLYDTLLTDLNTEEIVAVLAHEIGHYKHKHILYNLVLGSLQTGLSLYILSLLIQLEGVALAIGIQTPSFHAALVTFSLLYSPLSTLTSFGMHALSRKFEYQADAYAKNTYNANALISALKKLSKNNLSNLTPHPWY
ncbi:MAG: M48 family metallopeptidase, partial [Flavobacteriaceae bacterium]|nr:M48 family metallopeptidase [Flavobacteriaceae bacterium]